MRQAKSSKKATGDLLRKIAKIEGINSNLNDGIKKLQQKSFTPEAKKRLWEECKQEASPIYLQQNNYF